MKIPASRGVKVLNKTKTPSEQGTMSTVALNLNGQSSHDDVAGRFVQSEWMLVLKKPERTENQASVKVDWHGPSFVDVECVTLACVFDDEYARTIYE
jgi:hypothetical protein